MSNQQETDCRHRPSSGGPSLDSSAEPSSEVPSVGSPAGDSPAGESSSEELSAESPFVESPFVEAPSAEALAEESSGGEVAPGASRAVTAPRSGRPRHAGPPRQRPQWSGPVSRPASVGSATPTSPAEAAAAGWVGPPVTPWPAALEPVADAAAPRRSRSRWLFGAAAVVAVAAVGVAGFVVPGLFVHPVLDQAAVQDGVRNVLRTDYRVANVSSVVCPADQEVVPGHSFRCVALINNARADVTVVIQDRNGSYLVSHPS